MHRSTLPDAVVGRCEAVRVGDLRDAEVQEEAVREVDVVCHLAAHIPERLGDLSEAEACYRHNALATLGLAGAAAKAGVRRFVCMSTGNMYAPTTEPCTESDAVMPVGPAMSYFASKLASELYLTQLRDETEMDTLVLRLATPYGPGEPVRKVIPTFLRRAERGERLRVTGGGSAKYNFVFVDDVAACTAAAVSRGESGAYNVASGEHTDLLTLAQTVASLYDDLTVRVEIVQESQQERAGFPQLSIAKARRTWGYDPLPLAEGLRRYREFLRGTGSDS
jgi:nucleoside-diphosphate-sugar epimerase